MPLHIFSFRRNILPIMYLQLDGASYGPLICNSTEILSFVKSENLARLFREFVV